MSGSDVFSNFTPPELADLNQWISNYEFIDLIACGGMGAVYRARQISLDRMVAIKILPPELAVNESFRKSFEAEGKAMARVSHLNLVGVYDFGEVSDMLYLVIEFVEGSNLYESMGGVAIDRDVAVTLIHSVASGLAEAHRMGIVHRDIKPANILINTDVVPKLGDFGLAVPDSDIESGLMMGTPAYLAPEVMSNPMAASFSSDTYALGVILYELLCGRSVERGDALDLAFVPPGVNLLEILRKVIHPDPALRFQDGGELEGVLKAWLDRPNKAGVSLNAGGRAAPRRVAPLASQQSAGGGSGLVIGLVSLVILGCVAWFALGIGKDAKSGQSGGDAMPTATVEDLPSALPKARVLKDLKAGQEKSLAKLKEHVREKRATNRREFLRAGGDEAAAFLKLEPAGTVELPRYFINGEVKISRSLLTHVRKFARVRQEEIDAEAWQSLASLHKKAIRDLRAAKVDLPKGVAESDGKWVEWLGGNSMDIMASSMAGSWRFSSEFNIQASSTGKLNLFVGDEWIEGDDWFKVDRGGTISVRHDALPDLNFPWTLAWHGHQLVGTDQRGRARVLKLRAYDYTRLLKGPRVSGSESSQKKPVETEDEGESAELPSFQDPELMALTDKYRAALLLRIEPLEEGYIRVLEEFQKSYDERGETAKVAQIKSELACVAEMKWRAGFCSVDQFLLCEKLPLDVQRKQSVFKIEFKKRFGPIQKTYLQSLKKMLRKMKGEGRTGLEELEKLIVILEMPAGIVEARYVKLVSLGGEELTDTVVAIIEVLDYRGESLPFDAFTEIEVDSYARKGKAGPARLAELALDGNPETYWHSRPDSDEEKFPNWIRFSLGETHLISGFSITPRPAKPGRKKGVTNWVFYVSPDGSDWTAVAKGKFPLEPGRKVHLGFEKISGDGVLPKN